MHSRARLNAALINPPPEAEHRYVISERANRDGPTFFQEISSLPQFEESELDNSQLLSSAAAEIYRMRRARDRQMPPDLVGEPAWDMLLALYSEEPAKLPISTVCYGSGVPPTTALRWIGVLDEGGLVERTKHHRDGRIVLLSLTEQGRLVVERSLKAMLRAAPR
jgi:DNA-binding MarR family transcriptional regulator